jgi:hypothetical protein
MSLGGNSVGDRLKIFLKRDNGKIITSFDALDFSLLLPDVMTIADEVDAQLTQSMESYMKAMQKTAVA